MLLFQFSLSSWFVPLNLGKASYRLNPPHPYLYLLIKTPTSIYTMILLKPFVKPWNLYLDVLSRKSLPLLNRKIISSWRTEYSKLKQNSFSFLILSTSFPPSSDFQPPSIKTSLISPRQHSQPTYPHSFTSPLKNHLHQQIQLRILKKNCIRRSYLKERYDLRSKTWKQGLCQGTTFSVCTRGLISK